MKKLLIVIALMCVVGEISAQRRARDWRKNIIKIDDDLLANSQGYRYDFVRSKLKAFSLWNMGDYQVIDSREIRPVRNVLDFRPVFITEIFRERDFRARAFHYTIRGPENFGAVCKVVYQNYWDRPTTEILGFKMPYREYNVNMAVEVLPNTGEKTAWRVESFHNYGNQYKDQGFTQFFGRIYNESDTIHVQVEYDLKDNVDFVMRQDPAHFVGYIFSYKDKTIAALQLDESVTLLPMVWLRNDIPQQIRHMAGSSLPAFLEMTRWIRARWTDTE